jgi:hypothetical protein
MRTSRIGLFICAASMLALAACDDGPRDSGDAQVTTAVNGGEDAVSRTTELGPVKAIVSLGPGSPKLGDALSLTLVVEADSGVTVEMPAFGEALGRFSIVEFAPRSATTADGKTVQTQRYTLQPPMSGRQRVPPLRIEFVDERPDKLPESGEAQVRELLTEEVSIEILSVVGEEGALRDELRPPRGPLQELQTGVSRYWPWLVLVATLLGLALAWRWWQDRASIRRRLSAYDIAVERLDRLESRGLPGADQADAWYVELSSIVRRYLEDRHGVRAPELTTEEFLRAAGASEELSSGHRQLLTRFLEQCDRVKFAAYVPEESESREAFDAARRFLLETKLEETQRGETAGETPGGRDGRQAA